MNLDDLRRARKAAADKMAKCADALSLAEDAETPDTAAIETASAAFDAAKEEWQVLAAKVTRGEEVEQAKAASAGPADLGGRGNAPGAPVAAIPANPEHRAVEVGLIVGALAAHRGDVSGAVAQLEGAGFGQVAASLSAGESTAGGVTIPRPLVADLIQMLRPRVVVRRAGAKPVPMPAGQLRKARQTGSATASYGAENVLANASAPTFDPVDQAFKKLTAFVPISNNLLSFSSLQTGMLVRDDLLAVMGAREDLGFLRGSGAANDPKGLRNWIVANNWLGSVAGTDFAVIDAALRKMVSVVEDSNVLMIKPGWVMRPGAKNFLAALRNTQGNLVYPSIDANGELMGFPIYTTTQLPNNLGAGSNETEVMFADFGYMMIGEAGTLRIAQSTEATYRDSNGDLQSAFANDQTIMRAISEHDFAPEQDVAISGLQGVGWSL